MYYIIIHSNRSPDDGKRKYGDGEYFDLAKILRSLRVISG